MTDSRVAAAPERLSRCWGRSRVVSFLDGLAAWASPLAQAKASHEGHMRIRIHQGRLPEATITEDRRIA